MERKVNLSPGRRKRAFDYSDPIQRKPVKGGIFRVAFCSPKKGKKKKEQRHLYYPRREKEGHEKISLFL